MSNENVNISNHNDNSREYKLTNHCLVERDLLTLNNQEGIKKEVVTPDYKDITNNNSQKELIILNEKDLINNKKNQIIPSLESNNKEEIKYRCIGCRKTFTQSNSIFSERCYHCFCKECFKEIFQCNIEKGISSCQYPVKTCLEILPMHFFQANLPENYYNYIISHDNSLYKGTIENLKATKAKTDSQMKQIEPYLTSNVLNIDSNEGMKIVRMVRRNICPLCLLSDLFHRKGSNFSVCLNCIEYFCIYCYNLYTDDHFIKQENQYCRVYFRQGKLINLRAKKCIGVFLFQIVKLMIAFIILCIGVYSCIRNTFNKIFCISKKRKSKCKGIKVFFSTICSIIIYLIILPLVILIWPYLPLVLVVDV